MLDPVPNPPTLLTTLTTPLSTRLFLPTLPHHIHEVLLAALFYQTTQSLLSPLLSRALFPNIYPSLSRRTRINWDVHVVSLVQSCIINVLALWVIFNDEERRAMSGASEGEVVARVFGYTGACGLVQGLACGYFLWDLVVSTRHARIFGVGIWVHAITALCVYGFGFRPFANYYGPGFILYELSSPFLNVHWFCDKLNMTGSKLQWYNGMILLFTFFCCRLVWGTYQSASVFYDVWQVLHIDTASIIRAGQDVGAKTSIFDTRDGQLCLGDETCVRAQSEVLKFVGPDSHVPYWLIGVYMVTNLTLNALNWYWFGKMIATVRKRFEGAPAKGQDGKIEMLAEKDRRKSVVEHAADTLDREVLTGPDTPGGEQSEKLAMSSGAQVDGVGGLSQRR